VKLWRLDCGAFPSEEKRTLPWRKRDMPVSCYLVRHGTDYLLWDTGLSAKAIGAANPRLRLSRTIVDQLHQIGLEPGAIRFVAVSHYHGDHSGQASAFPGAELLIGREDWQALHETPPPDGSAPSHFAPWADGKRVRQLRDDLDLFGDGSVVLLRTPGHTPGHLALIVRLRSRTVLLSGDLIGTNEDAVRGEMPHFNTSRAETEASRERFRRIAAREDALIILGHEADDAAKLPPFPEGAE